MKKILIIFFLLLSVAGYTQSVTPVLYPRFIEGVGSGDLANDRKVPYACRMTLNGLIPNRLYYYYNRFVQDTLSTDPAVANGQGNVIIPNPTAFQRITAPNLSAAGTAGTFTTDANGSYTGWFITEPRESPVYYPGNKLYWRIMLRNDLFLPASAVELRLTASQGVDVLQWLSYIPYTPLTFPPAGFVGTLLTRAANSEYTAKNFVMVFDNVGGTGRPLGGSFVEVDGADESTGNGYILPYSSLNNTATRWGMIIPAGVTQPNYPAPNGSVPQSGPGLPNGIRNISQYTLANGALVNVCNGNGTGTFGAVNTVNPAGTQATGAGVLNIAVCGTAVVNCSNLSLSTVITGTACNANTGAIDLTISGGTAPYTINWSTGATTEDISGLAGGTYTVTVTDNSGVCTVTAAAFVTSTQLITLSSVITGASACVNNSGAINLTVNGGVGPYTYLWSNSATTEDLTGIVAGTYTVTVTGAGSCTATATYIVAQAPALFANSSAPPIPNCGTTTTVLVSATGGTPPYSGTGSFVVGAGPYSYTVTDARGCTSTTTGTVAPATCINLAEVLYPKYVQGVGTGSPSSDLKVPYASRMTITGLLPNATYRFFSSFTENPASNNNGAAGAMILADPAGFIRITSTSVGTTGEYGEFTTNGSGSFTGWFVLEPGSDIIFGPGNLLYLRIMLNDGAGGGVVISRVTATNPITVINWGTTSGAALEGSATYNATDPAFIPKNFVMLYDNIAGTGRPVSGTFIEDDGSTNTTAEGYDLFYELLVQGQGGVWGTIIPNDLVNGINNISQYELSNGNFLNKCTSPNGVYGTTDTRLTNKGNADPFTPDLVLIACTPTAGCTLAGTTTVTNVLCFGASTGAVNLTVTGATAPTFAWTGPGGFTATTEDISGLIAGAYNVTITDGSCTATASATVTQPASAVSASAVATNVNCFGQSTGSVNLTVSGGTAPYTYLWSNSATTEDISGLAAGTYSVTVTDANGCTATASATVTQPASAVSASAVATNVNCFSQSTGSVNLTVSGGTAPYTYLWSNSATTEDISGLAAGTYSVTVTDANGCTATASATVTQPASAVSASAVATNVNCFGQSTGSVNLTVSGGTAPYTYLWSNSATTEDISGLAAGTYSVTVTDANGCTATASATVTQPASAVSASAVATNATCGASNGSVNLTVTGGTSPYTYLWSNGATTEDISGLIAGTYSVTVTDNKGCTATASATVNNVGGPTASAVATNVNCFGQSTGSVNLTVSGGTAPYTYLWSNSATTEDISGLAAGTYSVTVTDANGCTATASATVTQPASAVSASAVATNVNCFGQSTGSVNLTVDGGTAPYTYLWSNSATTEDISGLAAGTYSVTVTDANGCTATASATVTQPASAVSASAVATNATCGAANGSVNLTVTGGTSPYTYLWSNGATTEDISGLLAGTYSVTVTDNKGCTATASATVNNVGGPTASAVATNVNCFGQSTGSVNLTVSGGTAPYTYLWSNSATTEDISGLAAGTYSVTVTDANGCTATASATVTQPASAVSASAVATNVNCFSQSTGSVNLTVSGGTAPYTYLWSNSATTEDISGLAAGTYSVTVTDANGCTATASATVTQPASAVSASAVATNVNCFGQSTGSVNLTVSGGTAPYTYLWSNSATTEDISGLAAGTYSVTVTDANGCTATASATVTQPASAVSASAVATNATCGASNGSVNLTVTGGTSPYTYLWSNGATTEDISGLLAGTYSVTVTDNKGCTATASATVNNVGGPTASAVATNVNCFGQSTGSVNLTVSGGTAPYTYLWSNSATTEDISGLAAGTYSVTVTDNSGCTAIASATVTQPASALSASAVATNVNCFGQSTGSVNLTVSGGTAPYTYLWSNSATTEDISGLAAGTYSVTVTDANGCTATASATVTQPASAVSASAVATNATCGAANGSVNLTVTGGTSPYTYLWSNGATTEDISGLLAGTYSVTVTDNKGCIATASATVNNVGGPTASAVATNVNCFGQSTGSVNLTVSGGTAPYTYLWSNSATTEDISGLAAGTYSVTVTDNSGCTAIASATVTQPASALSASAVATNVNCFGQSTGSVNLTVSGGTAPYTYLWSNSATTEDISGLAAGTYSVTVTDANGCTATASATVTQPASAVSASAVATNVNCFGQSTGSVNLTVSGGTAPYTYLWSNSATTEDISGLAAGTYSVTVTDANGCTATASATVTQPASAVSASAVATNATCGASNGSVNLTVTGGTSPYTYLWSNGATTEDISGLLAGTYSVTVTDNKGCTATASATVNNVGGPSATAVATNATCGASNGSVNLTVTGGTAPYTYLWSNGATTEDISGLAAGSYSVTVTDASACTAIASATVNNVAGPGATAVATNATCGASNGSVNLTVTGGTAPYSNLWSNGATTEDISGLAAGSYSVTVTDANGCTATASATVNNIAGPGATAVATNATCGASNGSVNLTVTGGTAPYSYLWSNGATTEDISGLAAGSYSVTVTDANGCTATASATVNNVGGPSATAVATDATCGAFNGSVNLTVTGGTAPYSYLWSNGATTEDISGLTAGSYSVTVTDANGCTATASATVNNVGGPAVVITSTTNVSCFGGNTGSINITVSGGVPPYSYLWSNGATTEDISGLTAGSYSVTVTDANECSTTASVTITQPAAALSASAVGVGLTCSTTGNNGTVTLTVSGGTSPYTYLWSNGATTQNLSGLAAGTYTVTVTDANGCTATASATIIARLAITATVAPLACNDITGTITVTAAGGAGPYIFRRIIPGSDTVTITGASPAVFTNVPFGSYTITVTDAAGCVRTITPVRIAGPLVASANAGTIACGQTTTIVTVSASQGIPPYSGTGNFTVPAGPYSFTVTDSRGCSATISGVIAAPLCLTVAEVYYPKYVQGVGTGSPSADTKVPYAARMTIGGLTAGATYRYFSRFVDNPASAMSNGIGNFILVNQVGNFSRVTSGSMNTAGEYGEFTTDGSGNYTGWFVQEPGSDIGFTPGNQLYWRIMLNNGAGGNTVAARATATNPVTVLNFGSTPSDGTGIRGTIPSPLTAKNFVMLYNNVGGTGRPEAGTFIESDGTDNTLANGYADFYANSVNGVDQTWGTIIPNNLSNGINNISQYALSNGSFVNACTSPNGVFGGTTDTKNANGGLNELVINSCNAACNLSLATSKTDVSCFGGNNGSINLTVTGNNGAVTYLWSNGATTEDLSGLNAGTYTVTVTETGNPTCTATTSVVIIVGDNIPPTIVFNQISGVTGPSSSRSPYLVPLKPGIKFTSILTVPDQVSGYQMVGIPDGLGAFDNGDGNFTVLMNHELGNTQGVARAHGGIGSFVSKWVINKTTLQVQSGSDLMQQVFGWNATTQSSNPTPTSGLAFGRFCSADLPAVSAFYNANTGLGTQARIFMHGEEGTATGWQQGTVATGPDAGKSYILGKFNFSTNNSGITAVGAWENTLANPFAQNKTFVIGLNDGGTGIMNNSLSVYQGTKTNTGTEVDKAGLTNGILKSVLVTGNPVEIVDATTRATNITSGTAFTLSSTASTAFSRPEDGLWNPANPSQLFFVTTDRYDQVSDGVGTQIGRSRLWRLNFTDVTNPDAGGTIDLLLDGTEGGNMYDNMGADNFGHLFLQEDVGGQTHNGKIWQYDIATDQITLLAKHDQSRFGDLTSSPSSPYNNDEESSGMIDVSHILGAGMHILVDQAHSNTGLPAGAVEHGQLLAMFIPQSLTAGNAPDTVRVCAGATGVNLGTPATADNCAVASVTNNAPATFPAGTTNVIWTVTDSNGNTATGTQVVIASSVIASASATALTCTGTTNDGTATVVASGGSGTYTYLWSPSGGTGYRATGLAAGTYTVTVTDANGCTATASATIIARLAITAAVAPLACNDITGTITVTAAGGAGPYIFRRIIPGSDTVTITGASPAVFTNVPFGSYTITVTDAAGCVRTITPVRIAGPLVASANAGTIACGQTTTIVTVSASQGIPPYSGTGNFTVPAGPYSFTVTDSRGCSATISGVIAAPLCLTVAEVYYPKYVQGVGTGSPSADTKVPYAVRMTIGGLTAGATYRYFSRFVDNPASAMSNGIGNFILVNQVGNFSRVTSGSMNTAGEYGEFTTDGSGNYTGWFVQEPGSDIGFTPGNQLYWRIMLNNGAGGNTVAARATATNPVTVLNFGSTPSDGTGIRGTIPSPLTAKNFVMLYNNVGGTGRPEAGTFIESDGTDNTLANGYADFYANSVNGVDQTWGTIIPNNLSNGINNISQYALSNGSFVNACTSPNGVFGGTTDTKNANGGLNELVINSCNAACNLSLATSKTDVSCFGGNNGSINLTVTGNNGAVTYLWSNGATTEDLSGLNAGTYTVTVTETGNPTCTATASVTITQPAAALSASAVGVGLTCSTTGNNGTVTLTVSGGTSPYTYLWSNGATTQNLSGLAAGTYTVTVTDANGCTATASATIIARLAITATVAPLACNDITGTITVTAAGGAGPYIFRRIIPGSDTVTITGASPAVFTNVPFGSYTITVTDAAGCVRTITPVRIAGPLVASANAGTIACGQTTTIVTVSASQGIPPYSGTGNFTVPAGPYSFTVTDSRGCSATISGVIAAPLCLTVAEVYYPKYVQGVGTGSPSADTKVPYAARMTIGGLTAGATYRYFSRFVDNPASAMSNGIGNFILVNQVGNFSRVTSGSMNTAGEYGEFTTDGSGNYTGWFVQEPGSDIGFTPGNQLYWRIMLNNGAGGNTVAARATATNPVTVLNFGSTPSDGTGIRGTIPSPLTAKNFVMLYNNVGGTGRPEAGTFIESDGTDNTLANGYADFYANSVNGVDQTWGTIIPNNLSNGINNISQYALSNGSFVNACTSPNGVFGGTTDTKNANGGLNELVISACAAPCNVTLTFTQTNVSCLGGSTGTATVTAANTTGTVTYLWSNGQTTATATGLAAGTYSVTVTDAAACTATGSVTITQPATALLASSTAGTINCNGGTTSVIVSATGGTAPYTGTGLFDRGAGTWSFTVTDANGCISVTSVTITEPSAIVVTATAGTINCNGGTTTVTVSATGGVAPYLGTGTFTVGAGTHTYTVTDANECSASTTITVTQPAVLTVTTTTTPATSGSNGTATANPGGGTAPYTYLWNPGGQTTQTATGLAAGNYTVTVTDSRGCTATATATVASNGCTLVVNAGPDRVLCNGSSVTLSASVSGLSAGTPPATPFTEVSGSTADMRLFSGNIDHITIGNTFSQSEDRNNCGKIVETSKTLTIPAGAVVKKAYLYWSGSGSLDNTVKLQVPGSGSFTNLSADGTKTYARSGGFNYFAARKDITSMVTASGTYTVKDLNWNNGSPYCYDNSAYGAWAMTVVYEKASLPSARIHVNTEKFVFTYPAGTYSTTINNVSVPAGCSANAQLTIVAFEGDNYKGERLRIAGVLDADTNNFRGQAGPNLDIITKNAPSIVGGTTSLTYSIESYQSNTIFGPAIEGLFDYVKVLKYNNCPAPVCNVAYQWTKNGTTVGTAQSISVNTAGTYVVSTTDCANCVARDTVVVTGSTLAATSTAGTINCNVGTTTVTVSASGGTAPYSGTGTYTRGAGTWSFTVTDTQGCTAVTSVTIAQPNCGPVDPNKCYRIVNRKSGKSMSIESCSVSDNKKAEQQTNSSCLVWKFVEVQPGFYRIINVNSNKSVEVKDASTSNDKEIVQAPYAGADHEKWSITANGAYFVIKAKHSGKAMSVKDGSTSNGAEIVQKGTGSNTQEQWSFVEVGCSTSFTLVKGEESKTEIETQLAVSVVPNPGISYFNLSFKSTDKITPVEVRILDVNGKVMSTHPKVGVNSTLRIAADRWTGGIYFAEVIQGNDRKVVRMIRGN